jgi:hypothetical protein
MTAIWRIAAVAGVNTYVIDLYMVKIHAAMTAFANIGVKFSFAGTSK